MNRGALGDPVVDAEAMGNFAGEQAAARGGADGGGGVAVGEFCAAGGEGIEGGCLDERMAEAGEVAITQVIGENEQDVGFGLRLGSAAGERQKRGADGGGEKLAAGEWH